MSEDVLRLMPTKNHPNNVTAMVAAAVACEIVSLIAEPFARRA